jgi:hypothetical protein
LSWRPGQWKYFFCEMFQRSFRNLFVMVGGWKVAKMFQ